MKRVSIIVLKPATVFITLGTKPVLHFCALQVSYEPLSNYACFKILLIEICLIRVRNVLQILSLFLCFLTKNFGKARHVQWGLRLSSHGEHLLQSVWQRATPSLGNGPTTPLWSSHQNHMQLHTSETELLGHTAAHRTALWPLPWD